MRPSLLTFAIALIVLSITYGLIAAHRRGEQGSNWDAKAALSGTRPMRIGESVMGKWVAFAVPTVICQTKEGLESYSSFIDTGNRKSAESLLVTPDHPIGRCTEVDASNRFRVRRMSVEAAGRALTLELSDGDPELPSLWARSSNLRIVEK